MVRPMGRRPVFPTIVETPSAVIRETFAEFQFAVKILPEESIAIACGHPPVAPKGDATPVGVICN
jgi:hypothetical protein